MIFFWSILYTACFLMMKLSANAGFMFKGWADYAADKAEEV